MGDSMSVVLADDHTLFREMLRQTFDLRGEGFSVVGEAADAEEVLRLVDAEKPDLLLLDLRLPKRNTQDTLQEVHLRSPETRVVILTGFASDEDIRIAAEGGARAYVLKRGPLGLLLEAVRAVVQGQVWADPMLPVTAHQDFLRIAESRRTGTRTMEDTLSPREIEVVRLVAGGLSNRAIAEELHISEKTVTTHLNHIFDKLGVASRVQAAVLYHNRMRGTA